MCCPVSPVSLSGRRFALLSCTRPQCHIELASGPAAEGADFGFPLNWPSPAVTPPFLPHPEGHAQKMGWLGVVVGLGLLSRALPRLPRVVCAAASGAGTHEQLSGAVRL